MVRSVFAHKDMAKLSNEFVPVIAHSRPNHGEGEFIIIPRGVEHLPVADEEAHVLMFEPRSTSNTGNVQNERTLRKLDEI